MFAPFAENLLSEICIPSLFSFIPEFRLEEQIKEESLQQLSSNLQVPDFHLVALTGPTPIPAEWLPIVERRIRDSIIPFPGDYVVDGSWLNSDVGERAIRLFAAASDVLPCEPYIYSSTNGDLVAEFKVSTGSLTTIIGSNFTIAFAVVGSEIIKDEAHPQEMDDMGPEWEMLKRLTNQLRVTQNGAVESK